MTDKSFIGIEGKACVVCGKVVAGDILIHRRLREVFPAHETMVTGFGPPCADCQENITRPHSDGSPGDRIALESR